MSADNELDELLARQRRREYEREVERKASLTDINGRFLPVHSRNRFIAEKAVEREAIRDHRGKFIAEIWIAYTPLREEFLKLRSNPEFTYAGLLGDPDALNGYVAFPKRRAPRIPRNDVGNLVQYIPVHGGVTYARKDAYAAVWGFDTCHYDSHRQPITDRDWIRNECLILLMGLQIADKMWPEFRRASQTRRAGLAQMLIDIVPGGDLRDKLGFTALVNTIFGGKVG
jgi:hypothetical protein